MKKIIATLALFSLIVLMMPTRSLAASGIYASGGKTVTVGQTFTVTVAASGANFNAAQGKISISGPVSVVSFAAGGASSWTWTSAPTNGGTFVGVLLAAGQRISSLTIATIKLKGTGVGSGSVSVSGVALEPSAGNGAGGTSFTVQKAPDLPGVVTVTSSSHPDQNTPYEATSIILNWDKASGVDGFSYLLDQSDGTTPAAKIIGADTSVTYENQAVGTYYFHIRAHKADGWGSASQFKITIKEPDPKIDATLAKPSNIKIERPDDAINDIEAGTLSGIKISGQTVAGYTANLTLDPVPTVPEGKSLSAIAGNDGKFSITLDYPLKAGLYKLTIQGQKDKVLTPVSDPISFEISLKLGGTINLISKADAYLPAKEQPKPVVKGTFLQKQYPVMTYLAFTLVLALLLLGGVEIVKFIRKRRAVR